MSPAGWNSFPSSSARVNKEFNAEKDNPLQFLHPNEVRCAELYVLAERDPKTAMTMPLGARKAKWDVLRSGHFASAFRETFGFDPTSKQRKILFRNAAWRAYVQLLKTHERDALMARLKADAHDAYEDFRWSRKEAKKQGDYKETRLAAADHLDRLGATEKPQQVPPVQVLVLQSRNYVESDILRDAEPIVVVESPKTLPEST